MDLESIRTPGRRPVPSYNLQFSVCHSSPAPVRKSASQTCHTAAYSQAFNWSICLANNRTTQIAAKELSF